MIGRDPWLCPVCKRRHANACPELWGGDFVPAPRLVTFADLRALYLAHPYARRPGTRKPGERLFARELWRELVRELKSRTILEGT